MITIGDTFISESSFAERQSVYLIRFSVATALVGSLLVLAIFTFPETNYIRAVEPVESEENNMLETEKSGSIVNLEHGRPQIPPKKSYLQRLRVFSGTYTEESLLTMFVRPLALILLPPVLWGALVMSVTIGFLVAVTSNVSPAYETAYGFQPYQTGLCFFAAIIGSLLGIYAGGHFGDWTADYLTKRNNGTREPEMRLPAIAISLITTPLALVLYGVGIQYKLHWMCPTLGLALCRYLQYWKCSLAYIYSEFLYHSSNKYISRVHN